MGTTNGQQEPENEILVAEGLILRNKAGFQPRSSHVPLCRVGQPTVTWVESGFSAPPNLQHRPWSWPQKKGNRCLLRVWAAHHMWAKPL